MDIDHHSLTSGRFKFKQRANACNYLIRAAAGFHSVRQTGTCFVEVRRRFVETLQRCLAVQRHGAQRLFEFHVRLRLSLRPRS